MDRTAILVPGMHRSGTSAVTRVLSLLGARLPSTLLPANPSENETGFWEAPDVIGIHDRFLTAIGSTWHDPRPLPAMAFTGPAAQACRDALAAFVEREFADAPCFVLKDPRMARLMPLWLEVLAGLNVRPVAVLPLRHPLEVADSLNRRNSFPCAKGLILWLQHVLAAEAETRSLARVLVPYSHMLAAPEATMRHICDRLECFPDGAVEQALPAVTEFLSNRYRHHVHGDDIGAAIPSWVGSAMEALGRESGPLADELDRLAGEVERAMELLGPFADPSRDDEAERQARAQAELAGTIERLQHSQEAAATESRRQAEALAQERESLRAANEQLERRGAEFATLREDARLAQQSYERSRAELAGTIDQLQQSLAVSNLERDRLVKFRNRVVERARRRTGVLSGLFWWVAALRQLPALALGLFDRDWYGGSLLHYLLVGRKRGRSPHPLMDLAYYLEANPEVAAAGQDPVDHYLRVGAFEGLKPHPLFDSRFYLEQNSDVARCRRNPLVHYLRHGWRERRAPNPLFDGESYAQANGCSGNPLVHYVTIGAAAGLSPGLLFDAAAYLADNPDVASTGHEPQAHYLDFGRDEGRAAHGCRRPLPSANRERRFRLLMVSHQLGGGVEVHCRDLVALLEAEGIEVWRLSGVGAGACHLVCEPLAVERGYGPDEGDALEGDLRLIGIDHVQYHHLAGFTAAIFSLADRLGLPYDVTVHDYALACPRVTLLDENWTFCGGPSVVEKCDCCLAQAGAHPAMAPLLHEVGDAGAWRRLAHDFLGGARHVVAPNSDVADRLAMWFPAIAIAVLPHPEPVVAIPVHPPVGGTRVRVAVVGGLAPAKGLHVLEACAEAARGLPIEFVVFGAVADDRALRRMDNVTLLGSFDRHALPELLDRHRCHVAALLSVWPETYCYVLSEILRAGLYPLAFDLGAPARRLRALEWGTLLPLDTDAARIVRALMDAARDHPIPRPDQTVGHVYESVVADYLRIEMPSW